MNISNISKTLLAISIVTQCANVNSEKLSGSVDDTLIVTATRTAMSIDDTLAPVSVITKAQIERLKPRDMLDLLSRVPGVDVSRNGGPGSNASLYLRGSNKNHVLVLIDGVRMGSATLGTVSLQHLETDQIERVEVVRGSRSSLYGSEAIGGVIQVFTKKSRSQTRPVISAEIGSESAKKISLAAGLANEDASVRLQLSREESDGIDSQIYDGNTDGDRDAYENDTVNLSADYRFADESTLAISFLQTEGENQYDQGDVWGANAEAAPFSTFKSRAVNVTYEKAVTTTWATRLTVGNALDQSEALDANLPAESLFETERDQFSWQNDVTLSSGYLVTLGYDYYDDEVSGTQEYSITSRDNQAVFVQLQSPVAKVVDYHLAVRQDDNEQFGTKSTYNLAVGWSIDENYRLILGQGTAFKAPTFNDLYWPSSPWSAGNPALKPEESDSIDLELRANFSAFNLSFNLYQNEIKNLIAWAETSPGFWQPSNVSDAKIQGAELSFSTALSGWNVSGALSYTDPKNEATGTTLARRANRSVVVDLDRSWGVLQLGFTVSGQSARFDDVANNDKLGGYGVLDVRVAYDLSEVLDMNLKVENIFDKDYQTAIDYHTPGRTFSLGFSYAL